MLTRQMLNIRILFTNYDIITDFLNLAFCSEHFISIKYRILATFNINKHLILTTCIFLIQLRISDTIHYTSLYKRKHLW
jgi:hypothetical protein